ncbi:hypothetical protein TIFTF001_032064 [Ficus carica]|uniref:Uncharacterized protein n=1 Tax=Ficus carica TaxID=3494 RepID=A0AA88DW14_FICCA|nr:hypothetical protein TIFTF001_032064 [Ficus carica]
MDQPGVEMDIGNVTMLISRRRENMQSDILDDILTKALGNAEHSGQIRGQSKFVRQSQYFNLVQSSRENAEVLDMKRQLAALERTV